MKMFLLGMVTFYLCTSIITLIMDNKMDFFIDDILELIFMFPFYAIVKIIEYFRTLFMPGCWYLMFHGVNPFCMTFRMVCEKLNDDQLRRFVKLSPKKDQKDIIKVLTQFKGYDIMNTESEVR